MHEIMRQMAVRSQKLLIITQYMINGKQWDYEISTSSILSVYYHETGW